jgi:hypothetical protein
MQETPGVKPRDQALRRFASLDMGPAKGSSRGADTDFFHPEGALGSRFL